MPGIHLIASNRMEKLAEHLSEIFSQPVDEPLTPETIVVQSLGMERWLSLELARRNGIAANIRFPFPNAFLASLFESFRGFSGDGSSFEPDPMAFRILELLPSCLDHPEFSLLKAYLTDDPDQSKRFQLVSRIADCFDQYLIFRPEMVFSWEKGKANHWQARLWRILSQSVSGSGMHRARLRQELLVRLRNGKAEPEDFPRRVFLFGISYLPLFHLQTFAALSAFTDFYVYVVNPCQNFWAEIVSDRDIRRIVQEYAGERPLSSVDDLHLEKGNRLLAAMGPSAKMYLSLVEEMADESVYLLNPPEGSSLLASVQRDILHLEDPSEKNRRNESQHTRSVFGKDRSIQVHSCHSPMREIEVLHDQLLDMFSADRELTSGDILVMAPRIEDYVPYIQAVFDSRAGDGHAIPYTVADRSPGNRNLGVDGFLALLELKESRFEAGEILALMDVSCIRKRFGLSEDDVTLIASWVRNAGIRWGKDGKHRIALGMPGNRDNTWRHGIGRLLLGYAMPGNGRRMFSGILPYDGIEGSDAETLGNFLTFLDTLFAWVEEMGRRRPPGEWTERLLTLLDQFLAVDDGEEETARLLRKAIANLEQWASDAGFAQEVDLGLVRECIVRQLENHSSATGFFTGAVTFCEMLPMRSIPAKVVCLVGMNVDAFPRETLAASFDLVARFPKKGDRSRRLDDRYLFLEALLSARSILYVSYLGRSLEDNSTIPPSILVSELTDYLADGYGVGAEQLTVPHRLQAFSPEYFTGENKRFSYSEADYETAAIFSEGSFGQRNPFFTEALPEPSDSFRSLSVDQLCGFFSNPTKFLLQNRLGLHLTARASAIESNEKFSLDGLDRYLIGSDVADFKMEGGNPEDALALQRAAGTLPHGSPGDVQFREIDAETEEFVKKLQSLQRGATSRVSNVHLKRDGFLIEGRVGEIFHQRLVRYRYASLHPRDLVDAWVRHLILDALGSDEDAKGTVLVVKDAMYEWRKRSLESGYLSQLLELFVQGMKQPLPFFPVASFEFAATRYLKGKGREEALQAAKRKFEGSDYFRGESDDPYIDLGFSGTDPFSLEFERMAEQVFEPILQHRSPLYF